MKRPRRRSPASVFISYRRDDAGGHAEAFDADAVRRYGHRRVFRDTRSIPPGVPWREELDHQLTRAVMVVAVVGPDWAGENDDAAVTVPRIMQPEDLVRYELLTAERRELPVVALLVGGREELPGVDSLPDDLHWLPTRQFVEAVPGQAENGRARVLEETDAALGWWGRRLYRAVVGGVAVAVVLTGLVTAVARPRPELPRFGVGDSAMLLIAPARQDADGTLRAVSAAGPFVRELASALRDAMPSGTARTIAAADPAFGLRDTGRRHDADVLALLHRSGADVLLTGTLAIEPTSSSFVPEVYLGSLLDAEELAGQRIDVTSTALRGLDVDITQVDGQTRQLAGQAARALAGVGTLLDAVSAYEGRDLERAVELFGKLLEGGTVRDARSLAVLHTLRGNALAELGDLTTAEPDYRAARRADPTFERSSLGLAELGLLRGGGSACRGTADPQLLSAAEREFEQVRVRTTNATIRTKAIVGTARVNLCRVQAFADVDGIRRPAAASAYRGLDQVLRASSEDGAEAVDPAVAETLAIARLTRARLTTDLHAILQGLDRPDSFPAESAGHTLAAAAGDLRTVPRLTRRPWLKADAQLALADLLETSPDLGPADDARRQACASLLRTLDLGPGAAIEEQTRRRMQRLTAAGYPCASDQA
jgi:tetratricopeptide (TPR) repeat protein